MCMYRDICVCVYIGIYVYICVYRDICVYI